MVGDTAPETPRIFVNRTGARAGRFYAVWVQRDLFGQWTVVRVFGGQRREPVRQSWPVENLEEGKRLLTATVKRRLRHGYIEVEPHRFTPGNNHPHPQPVAEAASNPSSPPYSSALR